MDLKLLPNPAKETIRIKHTNIPIQEVKIFSSLGEMLIRKAGSAKELLLHLDLLNPGIYPVSVQLEDGTIINRKLVLTL